MQVICLEEAAFYQLIESVVEKLRKKDNDVGDRWVSSEEAMRLLNVKAKSTMQILRDTGKIRFSQPQKKIILYDRASINTYLERNAKNTF
ncbi:MAG: helix-turn-helix domain-containing protein [Bacteroidetes bacterium]|nr:helix-turn-helix domain-containing protein [Bacteroidota bacterium]